MRILNICMNKIHCITITLHLHYINRKTVFFQLHKIKSTPSLACIALKINSIPEIKKIVEKKKKNCENEKLDYPRYLGEFYYHGTMNLLCISKPTSIHNWVTFCGSSYFD